MAGEGKFALHSDSVYFGGPDDRVTLTERMADAGGAASWSTITGKPTEFPPADHSHAIGDVDSLQSALDGKQATGSYATTSALSALEARVAALEAATPE